MNCYETIDLMGDALDDCLATESRAGFDEHLAECAPCRTYLDQLRVMIQALERMPRPDVNDRKKADLIATFRREAKDRD